MPKTSSTLAIISIVIALFASTVTTYAQDETPEPVGASPVVYVVQQTDTLQSIADRHQITTEALIAANSLSGVDDIVVGQRLIIPLREPFAAPSVIRLGAADTLNALALRYGVTITQIGALNRMVNPQQVYAGQQVLLPASTRAEPVDVVSIDHASGLWYEALRRNANIHKLMALNDIVNPFAFAPGRKAAVPSDEAAESVLDPPWQSISLHPVPLEVGRSGALALQASASGSVTGVFLGEELRFVREGERSFALLGINRWTAPGLYPLTVTLTDESGVVTSYTFDVMVSAAGYPSEIIRLSADDAAVRSDTTALQEEEGYIAALMSGFTPERRWTGLFQLPAAGVMSSGYGTARSYDLGASYGTFHAGSDLVAPTGTPFYAPAPGVVIETGMLAVRGYFTVIDHGWGVYTGYWHQSSILVEVGDEVAPGQQIGTIGSTGLSTAPHLHWEMWVSGNQVDPLQWVREAMP